MGITEPVQRGFGDWERSGNTCTITFSTDDANSTTGYSHPQWPGAIYGTDYNCTFYSFQDDEAHAKRVKAYWNEMRRPRVWWLKERPYNARPSRTAPTITRQIPSLHSKRKAPGKAYGGIKRALRSLR